MHPTPILNVYRILVIGAIVALMPRIALAEDMTGQQLAFNQSKGNCLACHTMKGSDVPSNVGPELSNMKARFPHRDELYGIIFDEMRRNPQTVMPLFGKNMILTKKEINAIVDFLYTL